MDSNPLHPIHAAWLNAAPLEALERLASAAGSQTWMRDSVRKLREAVGPPQPTHEMANEDTLEHALRERAGDLQASDTSETIDQDLDALEAAAFADPRLAWLEPLIADARTPPTDDEALKVVILGGFNAGKSSLINALLREPMLPVGMVPVTASLTCLQWGAEPGVVVHLANGEVLRGGRELLHPYTDDRGGADPARVVRRVELSAPLDILRGVTIFDTPGFNSGNDLHERVARHIILECDVVLWVFHATAAGDQLEERELQHIRGAVDKTVGIINHIDDLYDDDPTNWEPQLERIKKSLQARLGAELQELVATAAPWIADDSEPSGVPSGRAALLRVFARLQARAEESKLSAWSRRRATAARYERARRDLLAGEKRQIEEDQRRASTALEHALAALEQDWKDSVRLWRRRVKEGVLHLPLLPPHDGLTELASRILFAPDPEMGRACIEVWHAIERHGALLISSSLATPWLARLRELSRLARSEEGAAQALILLAPSPGGPAGECLQRALRLIELPQVAGFRLLPHKGEHGVGLPGASWRGLPTTDATHPDALQLVLPASARSWSGPLTALTNIAMLVDAMAQERAPIFAKWHDVAELEQGALPPPGDAGGYLLGLARLCREEGSRLTQPVARFLRQSQDVERQHKARMAHLEERYAPRLRFAQLSRTQKATFIASTLSAGCLLVLMANLGLPPPLRLALGALGAPVLIAAALWGVLRLTWAVVGPPLRLRKLAAAGQHHAAEEARVLEDLREDSAAPLARYAERRDHAPAALRPHVPAADVADVVAEASSFPASGAEPLYGEGALDRLVAREPRHTRAVYAAAAAIAVALGLLLFDPWKSAPLKTTESTALAARGEPPSEVHNEGVSPSERGPRSSAAPTPVEPPAADVLEPGKSPALAEPHVPEHERRKAEATRREAAERAKLQSQALAARARAVKAQAASAALGADASSAQLGLAFDNMAQGEAALDTGDFHLARRAFDRARDAYAKAADHQVTRSEKAAHRLVTSIGATLERARRPWATLTSLCGPLFDPHNMSTHGSLPRQAAARLRKYVIASLSIRRKPNHLLSSTDRALLDENVARRAATLETLRTQAETLLQEASILALAVAAAHEVDDSGLNGLHRWAGSISTREEGRRLLALGCPLNATDKQGRTPLEIAVRSRHPSKIVLLGDAGADANMRLPDEDLGKDVGTLHTPALIHIAAHAGHADVLGALLEAGARAGEESDMQCAQCEDALQLQAIHLAARAGHIPIVKRLIQASVGPGARDSNSMTPLMTAAEAGQASTVEALLSLGASLEQTDKEDRTALHCATEAGQVETMKVLLAHGANTRARHKGGQTPLHCAAYGGHADAIELLIARGADVKALDDDGATPLVGAVGEGSLDGVRSLLGAGVSAGAKDKEGETALHQAADVGEREIIDLLLKAGVPVDVASTTGWAPLHAAVAADDLKTMRYLMGRGANREVRTKQGWTIFHAAAANDATTCLTFLLTKGWSPKTRTKSGLTALHMAVIHDATKSIALLVSKKASLTAEDGVGFTPLQRAAGGGHVKAIRALVSAGADLDARNRKHQTALMLAALNDQVGAIELLLQLGADPALRLPDGTTALQLAVEGGKEATLLALLEAGASIDSRGDQKRTLLHVAALNGKEELVSTLLELGASASAKDAEGFSPLHLAAWQGHVGVVKILLKKSKREASVYSNKNSIPIHLAALHGHAQAVTVLLRVKGTIQIQGPARRTPLHLAAMAGADNVVRVLLSARAPLNLRDKFGQQPLHLAAWKDRGSTVSLLLQAGARRNDLNKDSSAPIHMAAHFGSLEAMRALITGGANISTRGSFRRTALHIAAGRSQLAVMKFLLHQRGIQIDARDREGSTPLRQAAWHGRTAAAKLLVQHRASLRIRATDGTTASEAALVRGHVGLSLYLQGAELIQR